MSAASAKLGGIFDKRAKDYGVQARQYQVLFTTAVGLLLAGSYLIVFSDTLETESSNPLHIRIITLSVLSSLVWLATLFSNLMKKKTRLKEEYIHKNAVAINIYCSKGGSRKYG